MSAFASILAALAIAQAAPPPDAARELDPEKERAAAPSGEAEAAPAKDPAVAPERPPAPPPPPSPSPSPSASPTPSPSAASTTARPRPAPRPSAAPSPSPPAVSSTAAAIRPGAPPPPAPPPAPPVTRPPAEREDAERAARAFLGALVARDAEALAVASAERFSFDGDAQAGRETIRRTWRAILAGREDAAPRIGAIEILPAAEAVARLGKPPARIAPLARSGVLVAVADVGGRAVVLFLAREGGRMAVLGMHD